MKTLAIDPGVRYLGWAVLEDGTPTVLGATKLPDQLSGDRLHDAAHWFVSHPRLAPLLTPGGVDEVVIERMVHYSANPQGDPNDLMNITAIGGLLAGRTGAPTFWVTPSVWKGQVPKDVSHGRIKAWLADRGKLDLAHTMLEPTPPRYREHAWDALGVGLFHCGELGHAVSLGSWNAITNQALSRLAEKQSASRLSVETPEVKSPKPSWARRR